MNIMISIAIGITIPISVWYLQRLLETRSRARLRREAIRRRLMGR